MPVRGEPSGDAYRTLLSTGGLWSSAATFLRACSGSGRLAIPRRLLPAAPELERRLARWLAEAGVPESALSPVARRGSSTTV